MKVTTARYCGFCAGVRNAVKTAENSLKIYPKISTLGDVVHNQDVIERLASLGLEKVDSLDQVGNHPLLLRAHGTHEKTVREAKARGIKLIDATCPLVTEIHEKAMELEREGRRVIIVGDRQHDEVIGIASRLNHPIVAARPDDLKNEHFASRCGIVVQSTQYQKNLNDIVSVVLTKSSDCRIINTICGPTRQNRRELKKLALSHDLVLVIGDPASANSNRLYRTALELNPDSYMIARKNDIKPDWFIGKTSVAITAGASTPNHIIQEVKEYIEHFSMEI